MIHSVFCIERQRSSYGSRKAATVAIDGLDKYWSRIWTIALRKPAARPSDIFSTSISNPPNLFFYESINEEGYVCITETFLFVRDNSSCATMLRIAGCPPLTFAVCSGVTVVPRNIFRGAEFAGPENNGPNIRAWKWRNTKWKAKSFAGIYAFFMQPCDLFHLFPGTLLYRGIFSCPIISRENKSNVGAEMNVKKISSPNQHNQ